MKKLKLLLLTLPLTCAVVLTSCHKDDDDDNSEVAGSELAAKTSLLSATLVNTENSEKTEFSTSAELVSGRNTVYAADYKELFFNNGICVKGKSGNKQLNIYADFYSSSTYSTSLNTIGTQNQELKTALEQYWKGGTLSESALTNLEEYKNYYSSFRYVAVIYQIDDAKRGETNFYYSKAATVQLAAVTSDYVTGSFSATLTNTSGDTFKISDGVFNVALD